MLFKNIFRSFLFLGSFLTFAQISKSVQNKELKRLATELNAPLKLPYGNCNKELIQKEVLKLGSQLSNRANDPINIKPLTQDLGSTLGEVSPLGDEFFPWAPMTVSNERGVFLEIIKTDHNKKKLELNIYDLCQGPESILARGTINVDEAYFIGKDQSVLIGLKDFPEAQNGLLGPLFAKLQLKTSRKELSSDESSHGEIMSYHLSLYFLKKDSKSDLQKNPNFGEILKRYKEDNFELIPLQLTQ